MLITIQTLKDHIEGFLSHTAQAVGSEWHKAAKTFAEYVEGKQAEADAIALLQSHGYTVTPPPTTN